MDATPPSPIDGHQHSANHRAEIQASSNCGCFYCRHTFAPAEIVEWVDELEPGAERQTALCPRCGVDSVIGDKSGLPITIEFLTSMHGVWFNVSR
jgi:hypothetical protein